MRVATRDASGSFGDYPDTAVHEAGHAVVAHALGMRIGEVRLDSFGGGRTLTLYPEMDAALLAHTSMMVNAAGEAAETVWHLRRCCQPARRTPSGEIDRQTIRKLFTASVEAGVYGNTQDHGAIVAAIYEGALQILSAQWAAVEQLAHELRRCRRLSGRRATQVLEAAGLPAGRHKLVTTPTRPPE